MAKPAQPRARVATHLMSRRETLGRLVGAAAGGLVLPRHGFAEKLTDLEDAAEPSVKSVAGIVTIYRPLSHADVLLSRLLAGWKNDGGPGPRLRLASMYIDQPAGSEFGLDLAKKHGVPVFETIAGAITIGTKTVSVDGVLSIGEHGDYPRNEKGQFLYPRRRLLAGILDAFEAHGKVVPVFNDKHPGPVWEDAVWMYEAAKKAGVPFMAGSSLPLTYRDPDLSFPIGTPVEGAVGIGYSSLDPYGFHALECYQCLVERRAGGERGVRTVQCLRGSRMWEAIKYGLVQSDLLAAALRTVRQNNDGRLEPFEDNEACLFLFEYLDGFQGAVVMLGSHGPANGIAIKIQGEAQPRATRFEERPQPNYPHFAFLMHAVEQMFHTGVPTYPVERTMLTTGILDRALTSRVEGSRTIPTPELAIPYQPVDYPHAPNPQIPI